MAICLQGKMQKYIKICHTFSHCSVAQPYLNIKILPVPAEMSETACISLKDTSFSLEHQADSTDIDSVSVNMTPGYCLKCDLHLYNQRHHAGFFFLRWNQLQSWLRLFPRQNKAKIKSINKAIS